MKRRPWATGLLWLTLTAVPALAAPTDAPPTPAARAETPAAPAKPHVAVSPYVVGGSDIDRDSPYDPRAIHWFWIFIPMIAGAVFLCLRILREPKTPPTERPGQYP